MVDSCKESNTKQREKKKEGNRWTHLSRSTRLLPVGAAGFRSAGVWQTAGLLLQLAIQAAPTGSRLLTVDSRQPTAPETIGNGSAEARVSTSIHPDYKQ